MARNPSAGRECPLRRLDVRTERRPVSQAWQARKRGAYMFNAKPTVFVVDDEVSVRESLKLIIESAGWQPETFGSAQEFLARPPILAPSCLVLDVLLPDLNGLDVQNLVANRTGMPIIFITGCPDVPTIVHAMKAGAMEFLTKPLLGDRLVNAIRNAIDRSCAGTGTSGRDQAPA